MFGILLLACNAGAPEVSPAVPAKAEPVAPDKVEPGAAPETVVGGVQGCDPATEQCDEPTTAVEMEPPVTPPMIPPTIEPAAHGRYRALSEAEIAGMKDVLAEGQALAYPPQVGPFGPGPDGVLVLRTEATAGSLDGFVETTVAGARTRVALPALSWSQNEVREVLFEDVDGDGRDEAIVMVTAMAGIGPNAAEEFFASHVLKWREGQVVNLPEVERRIGAAKTAKQVRSKLRPPAKPR